MGEGDRILGSATLRAVAVALLVAAYGALGVYFRAALRTDIVYTHFAYIPIVLAGLWWGRRGLAVAAVVAGLTLSFHVLGTTVATPRSDAARILFFLVVAVAVGELSEKAKASHEAERKQRELAELARRQEEQLVHSIRLAELGEMAAAIAHELNQPLTGIRNFARNALYMIEASAGGTDDVAENLRLIAAQVDRAAKIIGQMRGLARKSDRQLTPVCLNRILRDSVEFLMPQFQLAGIDVRLELAPGLPEVLGDRVRLEQVLLNLLTNAMQAMEGASERHLWVSTRLDDGNPRAPAGGMPVASLPGGATWPATAANAGTAVAVVEIRDTGKGFVQEDAEQLFAPFYTTKKRGRGTGLGLSISLSIIRDHQGTIEASGTPGKGARFTVRLPLPQDGARRATGDG